MRSLITATAAVAALAMAVPAAADHHGGAKKMAEKGGQDVAMNMPLMEVLAHERRADDRARDKYRRPIETLGFFSVEPHHTVVEYGPGGGWYTRVLLPYVAGQGTYMAMNSDSDAREYRDEEQEARAKSWSTRFVTGITESGDFTADDVTAFESDEIPEGVAGTVDRVLIFRSIHGMLNNSWADDELRAVRQLLKDDGMVGVVQHRAKADQPYDMTRGTRGYLKQDNVVALFKAYGFELVDSSEINANPNDPADHARGVWEMPPVWATKREELKDLGESDRMTLLFKKVM